MTADNDSDYYLKHSMARGAAWMVAMRWTIRAIGFINTIILARLLTPQDFGIVAMATVVVGLLTFMAEFSVDIALIRNRAAERAHYDSAWTLQVISGFAKSAVILGIAPIIATYYGDARVETVLCIIALAPAIAGFENIGQVEFRRDFKFDKEFRYWVYRRLLSFVLTIGVVLWLRNYLALAIAQPIRSLVTVFLSYAMSSYRPRFATRHIAEIWAFSKWWMLFAAVRFFGHRGEEFVLGGVTSPQVVGAYYVGGEMSRLITDEIVLPSGRALIPGFARISHDPTQLHRAFELTFSILVTLCLAAGVGASLIADELVPALLGPKWIGAIPFFKWLALHGAAWSIVQAMQPYFLVTNRERMYSLCSLAYVVFLIPMIVTAAYSTDAETVAIVRTATTLLFLAGMLGVLLILQVFTPRRLLLVFWRPVLATAAMAIAVSLVDAQVPQFISLGLHIATGVVVFISAHVLFWTLSGRPTGVETLIYELIRGRMAIGWKR